MIVLVSLIVEDLLFFAWCTHTLPFIQWNDFYTCCYCMYASAWYIQYSFSGPECEEGDIRLVNDTDGHGREFMLTGSHSSFVEEGRVEICHNQVWGTICNHGWDTTTAEVVCRQLNLPTDCEYRRTIPAFLFTMKIYT